MKRLILLGGGHAHVHVLEALGRQPIPGCEVLLVSPFERQIYSGMLPGWISGHYTIEACGLNLPQLAQRAGVRFVHAAGETLDATGRCLTCNDGTRLEFDLLSIDTGSRSSIEAIGGAAQHALDPRLQLGTELFENRGHGHPPAGFTQAPPSHPNGTRASLPWRHPTSGSARPRRPPWPPPIRPPRR